MAAVRTTSRLRSSWTARFVSRVARCHAVLSADRNSGHSHDTGPATGIGTARRTYFSDQHLGHSGNSVFGCRCQPVGNRSFFPGFGSMVFPQEHFIAGLVFLPGIAMLRPATARGTATPGIVLRFAGRYKHYTDRLIPVKPVSQVEQSFSRYGRSVCNGVPEVSSHLPALLILPQGTIASRTSGRCDWCGQAWR